LQVDSSGAPVLAEQGYLYQAEHGAQRTAGLGNMGQHGVQLMGKTLLDMALDDYSQAQTQQQSKQLMRYLLAHYLGDQPLHTRQLLLDMQGL
jgi:DNA repair protein RecO (recombination protein O)